MKPIQRTSARIYSAAATDKGGEVPAFSSMGPPLIMAHRNDGAYGLFLYPSSGLLSALAPPDRDVLFALGRSKTFKKGARIFEAGDPASMLYILETGRAKIYQTAPSGKEIILWFCFPGETFGLAELGCDVERMISAQAMEDSRVLCLSKVNFRHFIGEHPSAALCAIDILSARLRRLGQAFMNVATDDVPLRLARMILGMAHGTAHPPCGSVVGGEEICINITLTHQEIADMVGASRQTVTTALNELKRLGAINWVDHHLHVPAPGILERMIRENG